MSDFVSSNVRQGSYGPNYITSMENADLIRTGVFAEVYNQAGQMYRMHDFLMAMGAEYAIPGQNQMVVEKYAPKWPVELAAAISTGTGDITVQISTDSMVSNVHQARVGFTIKIPAEYMATDYNKDGIYLITALSETSVADDTLTCSPLLADGTYTDMEIGTEVPSGTYIDVNGFSAFEPGTGQPEGTYDYPVTRTYYSHIIKETKGFDGNVMAQENVVLEFNGANWLINDAAVDAEFRLKDQMDDAIVFSEPTDNADLTSSTTMSTQTQSLSTTRGVVSWLDDSGQNIYYTDTPDLSILDDIIAAWLTQGVYCKTGTLWCAPQFWRYLQKETTDYIREYSGGSDLLDGIQKTLGVTPTIIEWTGVKFVILPVATLGNPSDAGLVVSNSHVYAAGQMAIAVPNTNVTAPGKDWGEESDVSIPNLWIGYVNQNGENRKFMFGRYLGVNGVNEYGTDLVASDLDGWKLFWARHFMLGGAEWNKMVLIRKQIV